MEQPKELLIDMLGGMAGFHVLVMALLTLDAFDSSEAIGLRPALAWKWKMQHSNLPRPNLELVLPHGIRGGTRKRVLRRSVSPINLLRRIQPDQRPMILLSNRIR